MKLIRKPVPWTVTAANATGTVLMAFGWPVLVAAATRLPPKGPLRSSG
jgi:hypothetical protein